MSENFLGESSLVKENIFALGLGSRFVLALELRLGLVFGLQTAVSENFLGESSLVKENIFGGARPVFVHHKLERVIVVGATTCEGLGLGLTLGLWSGLG